MTNEQNIPDPVEETDGTANAGEHSSEITGQEASSTPNPNHTPATTETPTRLIPSQSALHPALRAGLNLLTVTVVAVLALLLWQRYGVGRVSPAAQAFNEQGEADSRDEELLAAGLPPLAAFGEPEDGIPRQVSSETIIPNRPRSHVITYTVQVGDNLFDIADRYGLKPETLLWGNFETLQDNPHLLSPGQVLNILPEDGTYHQWKEGDTVAGVAAFYKADPEAILDFPGNPIDFTSTISGTDGIAVGTWVIVPGGERELKDWGPPAISRANPAVASYYGEGSCGTIMQGAVGTGSFIWPTSQRWLSGYQYSSIHHGVDIGGSMGDAISAADGGVVVYSGWSNYGYGNLIVIDHGGGWQTAYAHLSAVSVSCGQSVYQGMYIGAMGSTGNSSGPHLHFEMVYNGSKPNPMEIIP